MTAVQNTTVQRPGGRWSWSIDEPLFDDPRSPLGRVVLAVATVVSVELLFAFQPWAV